MSPSPNSPSHPRHSSIRQCKLLPPKRTSRSRPRSSHGPDRAAPSDIALEGATLSEDSTENKALYGKDISNKEIVRGDVAVPAIAQSFIAALSKY